MNQQKEIKKYLRRASKNCPYSFKRRLKRDLKNSLYDYIDGNSNVSFDNVVEYLGEPEKFADEYILAMDVDIRKKLVSKTRFIKRVCLIGVVILLLIFAVVAIWIIVENSQTAGVYYSEGISE